jgi:O-antigen ligase
MRSELSLKLFEVILSALVCLSLLFVSDLPYRWIYSLILPLALFSPRSALLILFFALPIFGNRAGTEQAIALTLVASLMTFGLSLNSLIRRTQTELGNNKLAILAYGYLIIAILSLYSLPWVELFDILPNTFTTESISEIYLSIYRLGVTDELNPFYPFTALLNLFLSLSIGRNLFEQIAQNKRVAVQISYAILGGLILSLSAGLADYYGLINLRWLRALDPIVNPGDHQFRLQSFFGHSGWYAEYVTFCMPFTIILLLLPFRFFVRLGFALTLMIVGEYALILTYQRGGWLSYPLTLFAIWTAIYIFKVREEKGFDQFIPLFKKTVKKIIISLPLTILASLILISLVAGDASKEILEKYSARFVDITKTKDRSEFMKAGIDFGMLHPILGGGLESFALQYKREVADSNGRLYQKYNLPLHGSAHNFYAQIFSGTGLFGLGTIMMVMLTIISSGIRSLKTEPDMPSEKLAIFLASSTFIAAIAIYGVVQEIFYVNCLQILFWGVVFLYAAVFREHLLPDTLCLKVLLIFVIGGAALHVAWESLPGNSLVSLAKPYGCWADERESDGRLYKWCGPRAAIRIPRSTDSTTIKIQNSPFLGTLEFTIFSEGALVDQFQMEHSSYIEREIKLNKSGNSHAIIEIQANRHFIPSLILPPSTDKRVLSFKIY